MRRTKIIATLGPATADPSVLKALLQAGVDVVRLNFSHGAPESHHETAMAVRRIAGDLGRHVAILADLQGPKIRIAGFSSQRTVLLETNAAFTLDLALGANEGNQWQVGCTYKNLINDVVPGDKLLLDDGLIVLEVNEIQSQKIHCTVKVGGILSGNKGINKLGGGLSAPALTSKDRADIIHIADLGADYVAISFPRAATDIEEARSLLRAAGSSAAIIAKIERAEALNAGVIEAIIEASDAIMVARGDLGVEIGDAHLPRIQKDLISLARSKNRAVITATQMMESMIEHPVPTRAEVFDVANAVLDGTDAVMLSAETATGHHPVAVVESMNRICLDAELHPSIRHSNHRLDEQFLRIDEAIAMSAMYVANHLNAQAIGALTESGSTPLSMSRISSGIPIYGFSRHAAICRRMALYRGVYPIVFNSDIQEDHLKLHRAMAQEFTHRGLATAEDWVILTQGDTRGVTGSTNTLKIARISELLTTNEMPARSTTAD